MELPAVEFSMCQAGAVLRTLYVLESAFHYCNTLPEKNSYWFIVLKTLVHSQWTQCFGACGKAVSSIRSSGEGSPTIPIKGSPHDLKPLTRPHFLKVIPGPVGSRFSHRHSGGTFQIYCSSQCPCYHFAKFAADKTETDTVLCPR